VPSNPPLRLAAVGALVTALFGQLLTGTAVAAPEAAASSATTPAAGRIAWGPCEAPPDRNASSTFECATIEVPVDWKRPHGATVDLALARHLATDPGRRIGSLLINPGGPGGSGVDFALGAPDTFSPELLARFDIVGFDPRGVGRSTPLQCDMDRVKDQEALLYPDSPSSFAALRKANRALGESCRDLTGPLADHMEPAASSATWTRSAPASARSGSVTTASPTAPRSASSTPSATRTASAR
jgi:hypothetical protein